MLQAAEAVRCEAALHRPAPSAGERREGTGPDVSPDVESLVRVCDVVTINCPLHPETEHLFNDALLGKMKRGAYHRQYGPRQDLRPRCDRPRPGKRQLAGYAGDVWFPQPPPQGSSWRTMPHHGMTPHISGTTPVGAGPLRRRRPRDPRMLVRRPADPRGIPDRRRREAGRRRAHSYTV